MHKPSLTVVSNKVLMTDEQRELHDAGFQQCRSAFSAHRRGVASRGALGVGAQRRQLTDGAQIDALRLQPLLQHAVIAEDRLQLPLQPVHHLPYHSPRRETAANH